ncbi:glutaredoxin family protein [Aquimonas voraii]|uniref:Glutaredoxin n=1 Tax=Aquimonas voraii TaxID=265719 RepID=A0A1G6XBU7_9GAMM|nr:glutaredoxin family protein [Aquimonas voraii]SDD75638.1 Glutaredoxin [Aquimonas voraii]
MQTLKTALLMLIVVLAGTVGGSLLTRWWFSTPEPLAVEVLSAPVAALEQLPRPVVFTLSTCPACAQLRRWMGDNAITYHELSVDTDAEAARLARELGIDSVPVLFTATHRVNGYVPEQLQTLLQAQPARAP